MPEQPNQKPEEEYGEAMDDYPSPSMEEIYLGALIELLEKASINPLATSSSRPDARKMQEVIPDWFQKFAEDI